MTGVKSFMGLDMLYYALVTTDDTSAYVAGTPAVLAPISTLTKDPSMNAKTQFFDDIAAEQLVAKGGSKFALAVQGLDLETKATLLGLVYDATKGQIFGSNGVPPYIAVGFRSKKTDGGYRYWWFLKGRFSEPKEDLNTQSDQADAKITTLEYNAINTTYKFAQSGSVTDTSDRVEADDANVAVVAATWFAAVQLPEASSPSALTCTPVPADGATGIATSVVPTLTFNNALRTSTTGVLLTKNDGVVVSATVTINAAKKIITITPGSALTSAAKYLITLQGVTDIYGQTLANTVYDFTIA